MENTWESWKTVGVFAVLAFIGYSIYASTFTQSTRPTSSLRTIGKETTTIDCSDPGMANSTYCNGEYESQMQEQEYAENSYYQNTTR